MNFLISLLRDDDAATAVEYAVLLALILLSVIGAIGSVGDQTGGMWNNNVTELQSAGFIQE